MNCIQSQPGREKQTAEEGTVPQGLSPASHAGAAGRRKPRAGVKEAKGGHHVPGALETPLFLHRGAPDPSAASILCISLEQ